MDEGRQAERHSAGGAGGVCPVHLPPRGALHHPALPPARARPLPPLEYWCCCLLHVCVVAAAATHLSSHLGDGASERARKK
eukprot:1726175-Rhodomonas_salina.2